MSHTNAKLIEYMDKQRVIEQRVGGGTGRMTGDGGAHRMLLDAAATSTPMHFGVYTMRDTKHAQIDCSSTNVGEKYIRIQPGGVNAQEYTVECDNGWTVVQSRFDDSVDFNRSWTDYEHGFGDVHVS
jgi:hypothetical protein